MVRQKEKKTQHAQTTSGPGTGTTGKKGGGKRDTWSAGYLAIINLYQQTRKN
jgi:hypothetical protein